MLGEHDYIDKRWMYEESERMPFIIRYPQAIRPGSTSDAIVENVDFAPTLLDFAGARLPKSCRAQFQGHLRDGHGAGELEKGGLLPLLDAHGPSRQPGAPRDSHEGLQADLLLWHGPRRQGGRRRPAGNFTT